MLKFLIEAFKASKGRMPNNMEMILLRQKAAKQSIDERKVVSMFDRSAVNPNKPILGGKNIPETEDDIRRRLMKQNEEGIASMKKKLNEPEEKAMGGRIGYAGGSDMGTVADSKGNVGPSKGGYQGGGTGPVERPSGGGGNNNTNYDYTVPKQILKQTAINTVKNLGTKKLMSTLGLAKFSNPIGIAMALKGLYNQTQNPILTEEEATSGGIGGMGYANGGRIGYAGGAGKKGVQALLDLVIEKFGKKAVTTADKAPIPPKTLERDMFKKFNNKNPDPKRQLTDEEIEEYEMELGDSETWMNDGTLGDAEQALKNHREYMEEIMRRKDAGEFGNFSSSKLDNVNDEQIAAAVDDIFPTGDPKYDAEMASEALVENNPQIFGDDVLLDDLDDETRSKIYGAVYDVLSNNMSKMRELKKLSKPEKTLQSMKEGKGIDISDPEIADEFTRFMKEKDPKGYKELEQKLELSNFDTKNRKKNAKGGRAGLKDGNPPVITIDDKIDEMISFYKDYLKKGGKMDFKTFSKQYVPENFASGGRAGFFMGSRPAVQKGLSTLKEMLKYFGKKSDAVKKPSDILKIVNPKRLNQMLEDPNIYRKFDVEKGIAAPDLIKNMQKQMMGDRQKTIEEMLGAARNIKNADDNTIKYKNEIIEDMMKKGVDREMAEEMAGTISKMAENAAGKMDTPKLTDEGILQLENILKDMETGGKTARELNATGGRIGYKDGPGMNRRTFLKFLGGLASLPIIGKIVKPLKTVKGVKSVPIIKTGDVPGKPEWFDSLVNKVIIEGDDVTKKFATQDRQVVYSKKIDADNEVTVYRDLDTDSVRVDYSSPDVMLDEPVSLSYTRGQADETTKGMKPADEFETFEQGLAARSNGPDDYSIDPEPMVGNKISDLETDVSKLKEYATGKGPTMKEFVASKKRRDRVQKINEGDIGETSDYVTQRQGDYVDYDDYASGGIARMLGE